MSVNIAKPKISPNNKQQEAIDLLNGSVMLLAGPGTGKTFTVINRIEKMLYDGVEASGILCLTFSDAAATEMKQRLIKKMGIQASGVDIYTYHSFCNEIIKTYPQQFSLSNDVKLITDVQKIKIMQNCIDEAKPEFFVPEHADRYFFTKNFINYVEKLKMQRLKKEDYLKYIELNPQLLPRLKEVEAEIYEREQAGNTKNVGRYKECEKIRTNIEKAKELWNLYELYSKKMREQSLIDFSDMINFVLTAFEEDIVFLREVSNKYKYFLVDEYQDTNELQNCIIFNLLDGNNEDNIFVVGDDDQIIYGFQGAKSDNIEKFLTKFPQTTVICLEENNRSTQSILDFSYKVIEQDENRLESNKNFEKYNISKKLVAKNQNIISKDKKIKFLHFGQTIQEFNYITEDIENLIKSSKVPVNTEKEPDLSQIAIISKKRTELQTFAQMLKNKNIPFQIDEGKSIFSIRSSILIYFYLKALNNYLLHSDKLFGLMLSEPFKLELEDYNKILMEKRLLNKNRNNDFISLMRILNEWKNPEKVKDFLKTFDYLQEFSQANDLRNTIVEIINRTGILEYFYKNKNNRMENLMGIKKIISEAVEFSQIDVSAGLADFVEYLDTCLSNEIEINIDKNSIIQNAVQLTTYHGSKGREFEHVYLPNLVSKNWENFKMPGEYKLITDIEERDTDSELLKLLFVGITRAKHTLTLSYADMNDSKTQQITKYLSDLIDDSLECYNFDYKEEDFNIEFFKNIHNVACDNHRAFMQEISQRVNCITLSPSRLNDYLSCPRKFFYLKVLGIDVEESDWDSANYGSIIHFLLEYSVKFAKNNNGEYPDKNEIIDYFTQKIETVRFTNEAQKEKFYKSGIKTLESYYPYFIQIPITRIFATEHSFDCVAVGDNFVTGKIDRIEQNSDGTYELYDYKTGHPVSKNQVAPGGKKENYYNQLCFYKYAFEKSTGKKVARTGLIYVENHEKNVYKDLDASDSKYIENLINETYQNIKSYKFDPNPGDNCKYCEYRHLCKLDIL